MWTTSAIGVLLVLLWCVTDAEAHPVDRDHESSSSSTLHSKSDNFTCDVDMLRKPPRVPDDADIYESAITRTARALSALIEKGAASEEKAVIVAKAAAKTIPEVKAVALGAPQLKLGILLFVNPFRLIVFQKNNTRFLEQYWRTLASPWNGSAAVWSTAWRLCGETMWTRGVAAAQGVGGNRAAASIYIQLKNIPCDVNLYRFIGGKPKCDDETTECEMVGEIRSVNNSDYRCRCASGYWRDSVTEWTTGSSMGKDEKFLCNPCSGLCGESAEAAFVTIDLTGTIFAAIVAVLLFWRRKCKAIAITMWPLASISAIGASLMYLSGACRHSNTKVISCSLSIVLRSVGFVSCYGSVGLRIWCVLGEFRTRAAHRYRPRTADVLKGLAAMLAAAVCYAIAGLAAGNCPNSSWHHVTGMSELFLLTVALKFAHSSRNANFLFHERDFLVSALCIEGISIIFWRGATAITSRAAPEIGADVGSLRALLSASVALATICLPKLWYARASVSMSSHEVSRRGAGDAFPVAEDGSEPTASETRAELKRLYLQYEIIRALSMRKGNPHVQRRKRRRFSLQALTARRTGRNNRSDADPSRTPEDSVCSVEGPSLFTDGDGNA